MPDADTNKVRKERFVDDGKGLVVHIDRRQKPVAEAVELLKQLRRPKRSGRSRTTK